MKKHNFNAGPSILADEVIQNAAKAIVDFNGSGLSLLSISHRTKDFDDVMAEADALFRELLGIPDNYKIFYIGGGASTFFYEVPANFLGRKAGYVNTGVWAKKAIKEAISEAGPDDVVLLCGKGADAFQKIRGVDTPYAGDIVIARQVVQELEK